MKRAFLALVLGASLAAGAGAANVSAGAGGASGFVGAGSATFGGGGFNGPRAGVITSVAAAKTAYDDALVALRGHILRQIAHEKYIFADSTGEVVAEIDDKYIRHLTFTARDTVEIFGKVDVEHGRYVEIDVKRVELVR